MSHQNMKTWKNYNEIQRCWVPNCSNSRANGCTKNLFPLPLETRYRETWLAMAGKKLSGTQEEIYFCQDHFLPKDTEVVMNQLLCLKRNALPYSNMPQKFCRTCMSLIGRNESFSVLSRTIPCGMPTDMKLNLTQVRPEPLYQIITFCIPDLNLQPDPPPLVCCRCYHNIWLFYVYKITCNAVEKGLRGNLTPEEYGKMVLCRTCPETSGTSFFVLAEETLMGLLLKKMFLNEFSSDVVPLKVCLRCWNTLYKIKNFYEQCMAVDEKMQRHILLSQTGLGNISQYPATISTPLDTPKAPTSRLRDVRKSNHSYHNANPNNKNDFVYPQSVDQSIGSVNVAASITKSQTSSNVDDCVLLPTTSVIKFTGTIEQHLHLKKMEGNILPPDAKVCLEQDMKMPRAPPPPYESVVDSSANSGDARNDIRPDLQQQEQLDSYKRGYTWVPPLPNTKPVIQNSANTWTPPTVNTQQNTRPIFIPEKPHTRASSAAHLMSNMTPVTVQEMANTWTPPTVNTQQNTRPIFIPEKPHTRATSAANLVSNTTPVTVQERGNTWMPSIANVQSIPIQEKSSMCASSVANPRPNAEEERCSLNVVQLPSYGSGTCNNTLDKRNSQAKIGNDPKSLNNVPDDDAGLKKPKVRFHDNERITIAVLMLWYGKPLKYKVNATVQFDAWIKIVKEFHKVDNTRSLESIQNMWVRMKKKAEMAFAQIGPNTYEDQLVIDYLYDYPINTDLQALESTIHVKKEDCEVICLDDDSDVEENVTDKGKIEELNIERSESSSKIPVVRDQLTTSKTPLSNTKIKKRKRGRPKRIPINEKSSQEIKKSHKKFKKQAELAIAQIGPNSYERNYPVNTNIPATESTVKANDEDCDVICLDDEICVDENVPDKEKIEKLNTESGESSSKIPVEGDQSTISKTPVSSTKIENRKAGRPKRIPTDEKLAQEIKKRRGKKLKKNVFSYRKIKRRHKRKRRNIMSEWGYQQNLELIRALRKEYDKSLKNNELTTGKSPWKMLLTRLNRGKYKDYDYDKLYYLWNRMKRSAIIYEKNGQDLVDEEVWELLQTQSAVQSSLIKNSTSTKAIETASTTVQNNQPQISTKNNKTEKRESNQSAVSANVSSNVTGSDVSHKAPVKTSPASIVKLDTKSPTDYKQNPQYWTEDEKIEFFKLIKQEFNSIIRNREPLALPWRTIIERIASRGYKNCSQDVLFSSWSSIRRNATLHENDRQLTMLDCKVLRLLKLANKLRKVNTVKGNDGQKASNATTSYSETILKNSADPTANTKTVLGKNKHKGISRTVTDVGSQKIYEASATPHSDEDDDDGDRNSPRNWTLQEKLDLVEVIKCYDNEIFKSTKRPDFWSLLVAGHKAKGYKRELMQIKSYWHYMLKSAKLAWAQQKESSPCDESIIELMMEAIEKGQKTGEYSGESRENDNNSDEVSNTMNELSNESPENDETGAPTSFTEDTGDNRTFVEEEAVDDNVDVKLNYDYVSLEDIENDCGPNVVANKTAEPEIKAEPSYVSMEDCAIEFPPKIQCEEVIVIDDSGEE